MCKYKTRHYTAFDQEHGPTRSTPDPVPTVYPNVVMGHSVQSTPGQRSEPGANRGINSSADADTDTNVGTERTQSNTLDSASVSVLSFCRLVGLVPANRLFGTVPPNTTRL